jgi:hypothetical protein
MYLKNPYQDAIMFLNLTVLQFFELICLKTATRQITIDTYT